MVDYQSPRPMLSALDIRDPNFPDQSLLWANQARSEIAELIALTKSSMAESHELMAAIDEILARR